ncbi:MAG: tetratricopeptide repeat protein, partial [Amphritea sp.]|nr:tetratricopeptide repeat protein [Amphritea sp.]
RAADTYNSVIALDPAKLVTANGRRARLGLARLQIIDKNFDAANTTLEPLLKRNDKDPEVNFLSGLLALNQGDYKLAEDHVRKLLAVVPNNSQAQQLMGKIKYAQKDFVQAAHHLSIYLSTTPDDIAIRKQLTNSYIILNQLDQARSTLQPALTLNPDVSYIA